MISVFNAITSLYGKVKVMYISLSVYDIFLKTVKH